MTRGLIIAGTDTGIGKTIAAAALVGLLDADYWKPIQAGLDGESDRETVKRLASLASKRAHPEAYRLATPASPHLAAEIDGLRIDVARLRPPATDNILIIEGAGGLLVPLTRSTLQIYVFARWGLPVVLVASTRLGTINHTLLSLEALQKRGIVVAGVLFSGEDQADSVRTIAEFANVPSLGRLPRLSPLDALTLAAATRAHVDGAQISLHATRSRA